MKLLTNVVSGSRRWIALLALLATPLLTLAQVEAKNPKVKEAVDEFNKAQVEFSKLFQEAKTDEEKQKLYQEKYPSPQKLVEKLTALAEADPKSATAVESASIAYQYTGGRGTQAKYLKDIIVTHHLESDAIGSFVSILAYSNSPEDEALLRKILEKNTHREIKGQATFALAMNLKERNVNNYEAIKLFKEVTANYAEVKGLQGSLGAIAEGQLFAAQKLIVGGEVPEIEGEDVDGKKFKLSDYRGKVVLIDFWGDW